MMSNLNLREYQENMIMAVHDNIRKGIKRMVVNSPTGSGKTYTFAVLTKEFLDKDKKVLVLTHRKELLMQTGGSFERIGISVDSLTAESKYVPGGHCVVGMVETVFRRIKDKPEYAEFVRSFDLIIIDESHQGSFDKLFRFFNGNQIVLGFSATSYRKNPQTPLKTFYNDIIQGPSIKELISGGFLSFSKVYGRKLNMTNVGLRTGEYRSEDLEEEFEAQQMYDSVIKHYKQLIPGKKNLIFCPSVASSIMLTHKFNAAGVKAAHVDGETPKHIRKEIFRNFNSGKVPILVNVGIATTGFDQPDIEALTLFLATRSLVKFIQMIGRGARIAEEKNSFFLLDYGNNVSRFGFMEDDREWTLENDTTSFKKESTMTKICPECDAIVPLAKVKCECGYVWTKQRREELTEIIEVELEELKGWAVQEYCHGKSFEELQIIQEMRRYKKSWIMHQLGSLEDLKMFGEFMNYKEGWFNYAKKDFKLTTIEERKEEYENYINGLNRH